MAERCLHIGNRKNCSLMDIHRSPLCKAPDFESVYGLFPWETYGGGNPSASAGWNVYCPSLTAHAAGKRACRTLND